MKNRSSKCDNTFCIFIIDGNICYGQIEFFVASPEPQALVKVLNVNASSMMESSGNPCRPQLDVYKEVDYISTFIQILQLHPYILLTFVTLLVNL